MGKMPLEACVNINMRQPYTFHNHGIQGRQGDKYWRMRAKRNREKLLCVVTCRGMEAAASETDEEMDIHKF